MEYLDFLTVPIIVAVVCAALSAIKAATNKAGMQAAKRETLLRFFPLIAAVLGIIIGVIIFYANPALIPATNSFVAIIIGASSGLAATGSNQIIKQLGKFGIDLNKGTKDDKKDEEEKTHDNDND